MLQELVTGHGTLPLPAFMPDATRAVVRAVDAADLESCGVAALVVNTFHLTGRPGAQVIAAAGGVHQFMNWPRPVLADSGGYQVYSLLTDDPSRGSVSSKGFAYRNERTGRRKLLSPQTCIRKQRALGPDVFMALDHCTHPDAAPDQQRRSVDHTIAWARACRECFDELTGPDDRTPMLMAVVQGGNDLDLRRRCADELLAIGFDGYGFGGWPIDDDGQLIETVAAVAQMLPADRPKWALGVGKPEHVVTAARLGYDLFDCVIPTRDARRGRLYVFADEPTDVSLDGDGFYERLYIADDRFVRDAAPIDPTCDCLCCQRYSRAYVHHLFRIRDILSARLATLHNLRFYMRLMDLLRTEAGGE